MAVFLQSRFKDNKNHIGNMGNLTKPTTTEIPPYVWSIIHEFLLGVNDKSLDFQKAHLKPSLANIYQYFVFIYGVLIISGVVSNVSVIVYIVKHKLYTDATYSFLINNAASDIIKCICVLPISFYVLLIQNWVFGERLCFFLPMLQDMPLHVSTVTFLLIAWDRLRKVNNPPKPRLPACVCIIGTWITSFYIVLPYPIYITYVDLGKHLNSLYGVGICMVNFTYNIQNYIRGIILFTYAIPLAAMFYLYAQAMELTRSEDRILKNIFQMNSHFRTDFRGRSAGARAQFRLRESAANLQKTKTTQKYLASMVFTYAIFLCPLNLLRVARFVYVETYDNSSRFDTVYIALVWLAFLPTCSTPLLFALWQKNQSAKVRLSWFRNQNLEQASENIITAASSIPMRTLQTNSCQMDLLARSSQEEHSVANSRRPNLVSSRYTNRVRL